MLLTVAAVVTAILAESHMGLEWLNYRDSYEEFGVSLMVAVAMRFALLMCGPMTAAFLALVPRRRMWFSDLGTAPMYVYLLHSFVITGAVYAGWYAWADELGTVGGFAAVAAMVDPYVPLGGRAPGRMGVPTLILREHTPGCAGPVRSSADCEGLSSTSRDHCENRCRRYGRRHDVDRRAHRV